MSESRVFFGQGPWSHSGGGNISRAAGPYAGDALFAGVALDQGAGAKPESLTLGGPPPELLDQWLRVSRWLISVSVPPAGITIGDANGWPFDLEFEVATGATVTVISPSVSGTASHSATTEEPVAQDELLKGGVETTIQFDEAITVSGTNEAAGPHPSFSGAWLVTQATTERLLSITIQHGRWAWHGPLQKWCAGVNVYFHWSAIDDPVTLYGEVVLSGEPLDPAEFDNCPSAGAYHWNGEPGVNLGNETHPLWRYTCLKDYVSREETADGGIDPDMERAASLSVPAAEFFQIGTFMGHPMWVRVVNEEGGDYWDVNDAARLLSIAIDAAEYYPLPE